MHAEEILEHAVKQGPLLPGTDVDVGGVVIRKAEHALGEEFEPALAEPLELRGAPAQPGERTVGFPRSSPAGYESTSSRSAIESARKKRNGSSRLASRAVRRRPPRARPSARAPSARRSTAPASAFTSRFMASGSSGLSLRGAGKVPSSRPST